MNPKTNKLVTVKENVTKSTSHKTKTYEKLIRCRMSRHSVCIKPFKIWKNWS